jgi:protoheme IX farnesyltransferase
VTTPQVRITDPRALPVTFPQKAKAYVELTKPRIIELLLTTTVPAMVVAAGGWPGTRLVFATLAGGTLSAGGANAINQVVDRDIDRTMARTRRRPLPTGRVGERSAVVFGVLLGAAGFAWLWATVNLPAALLSSAALLFYVLVYSMTLKRTTSQNIVIGGAAGSVPTLVGWAAVTGTLALPAWIMFAIVFFWTPPHFWALAIRYRDDYAAAGVPMLPVVVGVERALDHILAYTVVLVGTSLLLHAAGAVGWIYLTTAALLGVALLHGAWRMRHDPGEAMRFFGYTNVYLAVLFVAAAIDPLILG